MKFTPILFSRKSWLAVDVILASILLPLIASAHPMGNFSISHHATILAADDGIHLRYRIDFAEIPAVDELRELDAAAGGQIPNAARTRYLAKKIPEFIGGLTLIANGKHLTLTRASGDLLVRTGAGGLPTLLVTMDYFIRFDGDPDRLIVEYNDANFQTRTGWREIVASASGNWRLAESDAASTDVSSGLTAYATDALSAPPQQTSSKLTFERHRDSVPATTTASAPPSGTIPIVQASPGPRDRMSDLLRPGDPHSARTLAFSIAVAFIFGAMHALSPGHGKALVAAYLVGSRGTARHACLLGAIVTVTHTIGVFALGVAVLYASRYILPERLYPWIGFASGLMILCVGSWQFVRRLTRYDAPDLAPDPTHEHGAFGRHLPRKRPPSAHPTSESFSHGGLLAMGISGGIIPCPSALIVLLSAVALHRIAMGLALIVAFSAGLASVLIVIGLLIVTARKTLDGFTVRKSWLRGVPLISSAVVALLGAAISWQSIISTAGAFPLWRPLNF